MSFLSFLAVTVLLESPATAEAPFGWKEGKEHRFVWVRNGQKVGETTFQIQQAPRDDKAKSSTPEEKGAPARYQVLSNRRYDDGGISQRSNGTTLVLDDGTPLKFQETMNMSFVDKRQFHQEAYLELSNGKAHARFIQGTKEQQPSEVDIPKGTFLYANQAVEHWAIFLSKLPASFEKHVVKLYYPDFAKVMDVTFEKAGVEKIQLGQGLVETTRLNFYSAADNLKGTVWLDASRRLLQIEFPSAAKEKNLRVTIAE